MISTNNSNFAEVKRIFISYNPSVPQEQSLAARLQTLSALYGLHVSLPDRVGSNVMKDSTRERIAAADCFIVFSTISLSRLVKEEIMYARSLQKKIVVVYDKDVPRNLKLPGVAEIEWDRVRDTPDKVLVKILDAIRPVPKKVRARTGKPTARKNSTTQDNSFAGFVLVGLGLLVLAALMSDSKK